MFDHGFTFAPGVYRGMVDHCRLESPNEACGLLSGRARFALGLHRLRNVASAPRSRYAADDGELIAALRAIRSMGSEVVAIYHSHPRTAAVPSPTDLKENYWGGTARVIVSLVGGVASVRVWWLGRDSFQGIPWRLSRLVSNGSDESGLGCVEAAGGSD